MDKVDFEYKINNKHYNEYFAKYLLECIYGDAFKNAKIADRPDIWVESENGGIGVEVTTLLDTYYNTLKQYKKAWANQGLTFEQIAKVIPTILKNKIGINHHGNLILLGNGNRHSLSKSLKGLETAIKIKLNKLQDYKKFESNNLFIFATNLSPDCTVEKINKHLTKIFQDKSSKIEKSKHSRLFENIMIFNYNTLQIYPFENRDNPEIIPVNDEMRLYCDTLAEYEQNRIEAEYSEKQKLKKSRSIVNCKKPPQRGEEQN